MHWTAQITIYILIVRRESKLFQGDMTDGQECLGPERRYLEPSYIIFL